MSLESYLHAGLTINIHLDEDPIVECPLEYLDEAQTQFVTFERNSTLSDYHSHDSPVSAIFPDGGTVFPLYKFEHGQVSYSITQYTCPWDSGQVGIVWVSDSIPEARTYANSLCEDVTAWCNGEVYGFTVKDSEGEELDSCWGFLGDIEHCKCEAELAAEHIARDITKRSQERLKTEIKNHVPLERREPHGV